MENYNITEAFKALDEVAEIELQDLEPKKSIFSFNDEEDVEELKSLMDIDEVEEEDPIEMIIDIDAEDEEELKDTYVGDVILQCNVCKSLIYKPEDQLVKDETVEDKDVFNVDEECPHCHKLLGYTLIGKVAPYDKEESEELQAEGEAGEDFEDEVFNSTEAEPAEDVDFEEEEEVEVKKESLEEEPKQEVLNESCEKEACEEECKEACEEAMFDNVKFDKEVFGKYFDENGHLIPELEKEYWKAVEDHRKEKEVIEEDTVKQDGKWVNKGEEGTHGEFKTKKEADAQRKAMFANGYKGESLKESKDGKKLNEGKLEDLSSYIIDEVVKRNPDFEYGGSDSYGEDSSWEYHTIRNKKDPDIYTGFTIDLDNDSIYSADGDSWGSDEVSLEPANKNNAEKMINILDKILKSPLPKKVENPKEVELENKENEIWDFIRVLEDKYNVNIAVNNYYGSTKWNLEAYSLDGASKLDSVLIKKCTFDINDPIEKIKGKMEKMAKGASYEYLPMNDLMAKDFLEVESLKEAKEVFAIKKKNIENGEEKVIEVERVDDADLAQKKADEIEGAWVEKIEEECKDESCDEACKEECEENCEESLVIENIDEELFDKLVNNYIKEVYDNIDSYTTTGGSVDNKNNKVVLEGVIKFKSGKEQNTKFIFEEAKLTKKGKLKLKGINETFAKMKKAFTLQGSLKDQNLLAESFTYNYKVNSNNEVRRIYGTERIPMNEELKLISDISDYHPWSGAVDTYNKILNSGNLDALEAILEDSYPDGLTVTELNDILWFDGDNILEMLGLKDEEVEESCKTEEACQKEECELKEGSKEIDRIGFKSLIKYDDPVFAGASHGVLNDGNFVEKFWADSDEEAIKKFRGEVDESCKEELEANTDFAMDQKVDKVFNELQDLAIEAKEKGEDYTADNLLDASSLLDDKKITEECKDESCELKEEADLPAEIIDEIHDTVDYFFSPDFKAILDEDDWKDFIITLLNEPAISEEGIANSFEDCSSDLRALLDTDKESLIYEEAKRYLGTKMAELEEACKNEACEEELADDHHMRSELADVAGDLIDLSIEARDKGELKTSEKIMDAVDDLDQENLREDINSVVINQGEEDEIKLEAGDIKEVEVKEEDGKKVIEVEQEPSLEDLDAEPYLSNVEDEIEAEFNKGEVAPVEAPVEMIAPVEDEEAVSDEEAAAEIEAEFNQE